MLRNTPRDQPFDKFDLRAARRYDEWYRTPAGRGVARAEEAVLADLLRALPAAGSVLEVGCGTGHFARWLASRGLDVVGLDESASMLAVATEVGGRPRYVQGSATRLPFANASFDLVAFITSIEFIPTQGAALQEACRVARRGILLGVLNLSSPLGVWRKIQSLRRPTPYRKARFFTPWSLQALVRRHIGDRSVHLTWRTAVWPRMAPRQVQTLPFGAFIGALVELKATEEVGACASVAHATRAHPKMC